MVVVDANVLLYAMNTDSARHADAYGWLTQALGGAETVGFAWVVLLAYLRIVTRPGLLPRPATVDEAAGDVRRWLSAPAATEVGPQPNHAETLLRLLRESGTGGNLVTDAHLAALALEHRARIATFDRDLARFPGVEVLVPGAA